MDLYALKRLRAALEAVDPTFAGVPMPATTVSVSTSRKPLVLFHDREKWATAAAIKGLRLHRPSPNVYARRKNHSADTND